ncbi:MAG: MotA/TolQ/ExbB proton channel family protein [Verrucomicrobiae bacterium]|nr:MotA/TolQ/ExbB proton channel family protein [Verrucomicrobiae bacterium]
MQPCSMAVIAALFVIASAGAGNGQEEAADRQRENYRNAALAVDSDLADELGRLAELRGRIAQEKLPLARETNAIAAEYREKSRLSDLANQERDALIHDLGSISNRVKVWRDESSYIESLLLEFRKEYEAQLSLPAAEGKTDLLSEASGDNEAGISAQLTLIENAIEGLNRSNGLLRIEGRALGEDGISRKGEFVEAGPISWFVSDDNLLAGLVVAGSDSQVEVIPKTASAKEVRSLMEGRGGLPRFDPTLGIAIALGASDDSLIEHIQQGGLWIYPILLLALVAIVAAIGKWIQLSGIRPLESSVVRSLLTKLNAGKPEEASSSLEGIRHPARALLIRGMEVRDRSRGEMEEALYEKYLEAQPSLQRGLASIAIASATAPLLGLLGTVTGMIHTFKLINLFGTGDAKSLASGISEALVTTEFGLVVAIPALILHALLSRKVQGINSTMEMTSLAFVNGLETPALAETNAKPSLP